VDLDDLFGDGAELGNDVIVKAQLRFRVHPPKHRVAQDLLDRLVASYDERLDMICSEVSDVLRHADLRRSARSQPLVLDLGRKPWEAISKAGQQVYTPGAKGGKWYRDGAGHIRYGEQPMPQYKQRATQDHTTPNIGHYRPHPFMGLPNIDQDLTAFLMDKGGKYGFNKPELRFLGAWYGTSTKTGSLFNAFLDCAQLTREDLAGDITQLRFGGQKLTYEEAVFEFFAAQRSLFMGDESEVEDADEAWNTMLNDQIRPLLDNVFSKYEALKESEDFKNDYTSEPNKLTRKFFENARKCQKDTNSVADHITSGWDPMKQVDEVIAGMQKLGLFSKPSMVDDHAHAHDRPHLKDSIVLDDRLLTEQGNPLIGKKEKLPELTASQLMLLYAAAELHRRWDPDTRSYSNEPQSDIGPGSLGEAVIQAIGSKSEQWAGAVGFVRKHLDKVVDRLVTALNHANAHLDRPEHKKRRSKK
jgi:hypothetical protein